MSDMFSSFRRNAAGRKAVYVANLLVSFHYFTVVYINSTFLSRFVSAEVISLLYVAGSLVSVAVFSVFPRIVRRIGNYRAAVVFMLFEMVALAGLAAGRSLGIVISSFLLYLVVSPIIYLDLDIFLEKLTTDEHKTGGVRGVFLTMQNITQVACPLLLGLFLYDSAYWRIYLISIGFLLAALIFLATRLRRFNDARYHPRTVWQSASYVLKHPVLYHVVVAQALLRFFYAWMVIYVPLYLFNYVGFSWAEISVMFSIMLLPFLLLELPLGRVADSRLDEREIMIVGFALLVLTVAAIPFIAVPAFLIWTAVLFASRVGAACVEIATESYFFKHVDGSLADTISLFRMARPVMYVAAAGVAALTLQVLPLGWSFLVLAAILAWGLPHAFALKDIRW